MQNKKLEAFDNLLNIMDELREKCPWDREQTFESLRNNTIEETYELIDAIGDGDVVGIREELGDVLLHVVFYSKIAQEQGLFTIEDVANGISEKLVRRHPHVFADTQADDSAAVIQNWEEIKRVEKKERRGTLSGVPRSLPAMVKAYRVGQKAAAAGFDWQKREDVWAKVREEAGELEHEIAVADKVRMEEEFGDLFFALVNAARLYGIDPEAALEGCNKRFIRRFEHIEQAATTQGLSIKQMTLDQMNELWEQAKGESS